MPNGKMYTKNFNQIGLVSAKWWQKNILKKLLQF
jgi:hypothetical protein